MPGLSALSTYAALIWVSSRRDSGGMRLAVSMPFTAAATIFSSGVRKARSTPCRPGFLDEIRLHGRKGSVISPSGAYSAFSGSKISSRARLATHRYRCPPASPQVATR